ncbi:MAG: hypothetical protein AAGD10_16565 [Myxococcota bacterium]
MKSMAMSILASVQARPGLSLVRGLCLGVLVYFVAPLWRDFHSWGGTFDWGYFFFLAEVDRKTLVEFGQMPLWNPYYCGGAVHLSNPQTYTLSPLQIFVFVFGTPIGIRLMLTVTPFLALAGARLWALRLGLSEAGAWAAGTSMALSGTIAQHLGGGHVGWVGFALVPWVLWAFHAGLEGDRRMVVVGGAFLAWIFFHWGAYQYPYTCVALGVYGLILGLSRRQLPSAVGLGLGMAVVSLGLVSIRLLPLVAFISEHPRTVHDSDWLSWADLWEIYAVRHEARRFGYHGWAWPEYGNYYGVLGLVLVGVGLLLALRRRRFGWVPVIICLFLFVAFQMGNWSYGPWTWLRKLPVFENLRVPSRFTALVSVFAAPLVGLAAQRLAALGPRPKLGAWLAGVVLIAHFVDVAEFNRRQWIQTFGTPPPRDVPSSDFHNVSGDRRRMYAYPRVNRGSIDCFEESPLPRSRLLQAEAPQEEYPVPEDAGRVRRVDWSPNAITLDVELTRSATLAVNQNWAPGWRSDAGPTVSHQGLLALPLEAGAHRVRFVYRPPFFWLGVAISILSLVGAVAWVLACGVPPAQRARIEPD